MFRFIAVPCPENIRSIPERTGTIRAGLHRNYPRSWFQTWPPAPWNKALRRGRICRTDPRGTSPESMRTRDRSECGDARPRNSGSPRACTRAAHSIRRTAVCGPAVRWCGRGVAARLPPIPIPGQFRGAPKQRRREGKAGSSGGRPWRLKCSVTFELSGRLRRGRGSRASMPGFRQEYPPHRNAYLTSWDRARVD